jgi:hypothetical protein
MQVQFNTVPLDGLIDRLDIAPFKLNPNVEDMSVFSGIIFIVSNLQCFVMEHLITNWYLLRAYSKN